MSATGTYLEIPGDVVLHVGEGAPRADELAAALRPLEEDAERRRRLGAAAKRYLAATISDERTARGYEEAIEGTLDLLTDPRRLALARWARALSDFEIGKEQLDAGWGLSYVHALQETVNSPPGDGS